MKMYLRFVTIGIILASIVTCWAMYLQSDRIAKNEPDPAPVEMREVDSTKVSRVLLFDSYELIYTKTGFLKDFKFTPERMSFREETKQGIFTTTFSRGEYTTCIIEEFPSLAEVPPIPKDFCGEWPSVEDSQ